MMIKLGLIRPNTNVELFKIYSESLSLGYLSAVLRENEIATDLIDAYLEDIAIEDLTGKILINDYKLIGFSIYNATSIEWVSKAVKLIKKENSSIHITMGGHTPSFDYEYILQSIPEIDSIVRFEGEYILLDLARVVIDRGDWKAIKGLAFREGSKVISNELAPLVANLDELPFPHRDYIPYLKENHGEVFTTYISRGRGCYRKCTFCSVPHFFSFPNGKVFRQRSNENLIAEIETLVNNYQVKDFTFIDDIFILPSNEGKLNTINLATELQKRQFGIQFSISERIDNLNEEVVETLISAGLTRIFLGLEAATQGVLDKLDKKINRRIMESKLEWLSKKKIDVEISFINFLPFNNIDDIRENILFFSDLGLDTLRSLGNKLEPYPGTSIYNTLKTEENLYKSGFSYDYIVNTTDPMVDTLYRIIEPSIPFLALVSYQLRLTKMFIRKIGYLEGKTLFDSFVSLQQLIIFEVRDIFLDLIVFLRKGRNPEVEPIRKEVYQTLSHRTIIWIGCLLDLKKKLGKEVCHGTAV